jgi:Membrane domain of glycerophosphoryl diester phosphodiesterase
MTSSAPLRPRSPSEIVDAAFQILRTHYVKFVMCAAIAYVPLLIFRLLVIGDPRNVLANPDAALPQGLGTTYFLAVVVSMFAYSLMGALLVGCTAQAYMGEEVDVRAALRRVLKRLPSLLVATILSWLLVLVALVLFLFPAMYVGARVFAVIPAIMLEDASVAAAFRRSSELSEGRKWHILNTLGLALLIYFVIFFGVTALAAIVGSFIVQSLATTLVSICVYPAVAITGVLLYYDARIQREGLDIELMADALAPTDAPAAP